MFSITTVNERDPKVCGSTLIHIGLRPWSIRASPSVRARTAARPKSAAAPSPCPRAGGSEASGLQLGDKLVRLDVKPLLVRSVGKYTALGCVPVGQHRRHLVDERTDKLQLISKDFGFAHWITIPRLLKGPVDEMPINGKRPLRAAPRLAAARAAGGQRSRPGKRRATSSRPVGSPGGGHAALETGHRVGQRRALSWRC